MLSFGLLGLVCPSIAFLSAAVPLSYPVRASRRATFGQRKLKQCFSCRRIDAAFGDISKALLHLTEGILSPAAYRLFFEGRNFLVQDCLTLHSVTSWCEVGGYSSPSLAGFKYGYRSLIFSLDTAERCNLFNTEPIPAAAADSQRCPVIMEYKTSMSTITTELRPDAASYYGRGRAEIPIYPMPFVPNVSCPVTAPSPRNVKELQAKLKSLHAKNLTPGSAHSFVLNDTELVSVRRDWVTWANEIDAVVKSPDSDKGTWSMESLKEAGIRIQEAGQARAVAKTDAQRQADVDGLLLLRRISPKIAQIRTQATTAARKRASAVPELTHDGEYVQDEDDQDPGSETEPDPGTASGPGPVRGRGGRGGRAIRGGRARGRGGRVQGRGRGRGRGHSVDPETGDVLRAGVAQLQELKSARKAVLMRGRARGRGRSQNRRGGGETHPVDN